MSKTILFFGTDEFSAPALEALVDAGYSIAAVVTKPDSKQGRGHTLTPPIVKIVAERFSIPVWQPTRLSDITEAIKALGPVAGVLSSYGKIIPQATIDLFAPGIINIHPSLLPKYRGPSPIETAIANGDPETGVSLMLLSAAMDAGPVYTQEIYPLTGAETQPELTERLAATGSRMLIQHLPDILSGALTATPQDESAASYCSLLRREDGALDLSQLTAAEAERKVRAYLTYPRCRQEIFGHTVIVTKAHVSPVEDGLSFISKDGSFFTVDEIVGPNGRRMDGKSFRNGYAAGA